MATKDGKKTGGRVVGSRNKPKPWLAQIQADHPGWHPVRQLAAVANDPDADPARRDAAATTCARYMAPQLKAVEHSGGIASAITIDTSPAALAATVKTIKTAIDGG